MSRERRYLKRFNRIADNARAAQTLDLFRETEVATRRKAHLILIVRRQARRLEIELPEDLESKSEADVLAIRIEQSLQIAGSKTQRVAPASSDSEVVAR